MNGTKFRHLDYHGDKTTYKVRSIKYIFSFLTLKFFFCVCLGVFLFLL